MPCDSTKRWGSGMCPCSRQAAAGALLCRDLAYTGEEARAPGELAQEIAMVVRVLVKSACLSSGAF